MANKNITQLTPQTGSADATSLFYTVTGGNSDKSLPLSVFVNNLGLTGVPTAPTATVGTNTAQIASTAFVQASLGSYAPLSNPTFTGTIGGGAASINLVGVASFASIQATPIGTTSSAAGTFTTLTANTALVVNGTLSGAGVSTYLASPPAIGSTTPAPGSFTTLSSSGAATLNSLSTSSATISGGTINGTSVGATTASTGRFTTLTATSTITPSSTSGIVGTTTNDNANAGSVGEYITATAGPVSLTTATNANVVSISLTAGDWDVWGAFNYSAAATTTTSSMQAGITSVSVGLPANPLSFFSNGTFPTNTTQQHAVPQQRFSLSTTTTIYLVATATFATSTATAQGFIAARRVR